MYDRWVGPQLTAEKKKKPSHANWANDGDTGPHFKMDSLQLMSHTRPLTAPEALIPGEMRRA